MKREDPFEKFQETVASMRPEVLAFIAAQCPDFRECARHAKSDATTLGLFYDKCAKHRAEARRLEP